MNGFLITALISSLSLLLAQPQMNPTFNYFMTSGEIQTMISAFRHKHHFDFGRVEFVCLSQEELHASTKRIIRLRSYFENPTGDSMNELINKVRNNEERYHNTDIFCMFLTRDQREEQLETTEAATTTTPTTATRSTIDASKRSRRRRGRKAKKTTISPQ